MRSQKPSTEVLMYFYGLIYLNFGGSFLSVKYGTADLYVCYLGGIITTEV